MGLDNDGIEQAFTTHLLNHRALEVAHLLAENLAETLGILHEVLVLDHLQGGDGDLGGNGVATEGGTMLTRFDIQHDIIVGQHGAHGHHATAEGLAEDKDVGTHILVVAGQHLTRTGDTALHLVGHEQHIVFLADIIAFLQVAIVRHIDAGLTLDGFEQEARHLLAVFSEAFLQRVGIVVGNAQEAGGHGTIVGVALGVVAHGDDGDGAAVEVTLAADDFHLVVGDAFFHHTPTAGQLQTCLVGLGTGVHGQHLVIAEIFGDIFLPLTQTVIVESTAREGQLVGLVAHSLDNLRVAMTLVDSGIGGKEVKIAFAFAVPHKSAFAFGEDNG